jgi:hypothetical protein
MPWTKENNPHSKPKLEKMEKLEKLENGRHKIHLTWDQETHTRVLTLDGRTIPGVKRVYVESLVHSAEVHLVLENLDIEVELDTAETTLEEYTGG